MSNHKSDHTKLYIVAGLFSLFLLILLTGSVDAQRSLAGLRLLVWSPDGPFLLGSTPGQIVTLPDNTIRQTRILWRLSPDGSDTQQLAEGFNPQLSADGRFITFITPGTTELRGINITTAKVQPLPIDIRSASDMHVAGDPPGRAYVSPDGQKRAILANEFFSAALWIGETNAPAQLVLSAEGEIFSDLAWHPNSNALVLIRTPLGSQVESAGDLWRIDLDTNQVTRLSQNNVVDRSPVWSADGSSLAVMRNEQLTIVPANQRLIEQFTVSPPLISEPAPPLQTQAQLIVPNTIRVIHHASNTCRNVPVGQIDVIPFEDYVKRVVPHEVYPSWPAETLKAQAVAARTYAWYQILSNAALAYDVTDWINYQYMCDTTYPTTNQAVDDTAGQYIAYNGSVISAMFSAENSSPTKTSPWVNYLLSVDDPVSFGQPLFGHGYGMGQWGAQRWAAQHSWTYQAILRHYYSNVTIEQGRDAFSIADTNAPIVSVVAPWSNHYATGNKMRLLINANDDYGVISQTNLYLSSPGGTTLLINENGPPANTGYLVDVSAWTDQALVANTLVLTAEAFDNSHKRGVSAPVTIGLDRISPTGQLTTATTLTGTTIITDSPVVSLTLIGSDATAGLSQIATGRYDWLWEGENFTRQEVNGQPVGQIVSDGDALNGAAIQATVGGNPAGDWSSAQISLPMPKPYQAYFRVKTNDNTTLSEVAQLKVINSQNGDLLGIHRLYGPDFRDSGVYQEFHVDFNHQTTNPVILRLAFQDKADIWLDRVIVVDYPVNYTSTPVSPWFQFRLKIIDGAGNVSEDLLVLPTQHVYLPFVIKSPDPLEAN